MSVRDFLLEFLAYSQQIGDHKPEKGERAQRLATPYPPFCRNASKGQKNRRKVPNDNLFDPIAEIEPAAAHFKPCKSEDQNLKKRGKRQALAMRAKHFQPVDCSARCGHPKQDQTRGGGEGLETHEAAGSL